MRYTAADDRSNGYVMFVYKAKAKSHTNLVFIVVLSMVWCAQSIAADKIKETEDQVLFVTEGDFEEVKENVELAITGQGLVINNIATVGDMLEKTGKDLGATRQVYIHGDVFEFCSATLSREMLEADQNNLAFCPYTIQVFQIPEQPEQVFVGYRRPPIVGDDGSRTALRKVDALLAKIVDEALTW